MIYDFNAIANQMEATLNKSKQKETFLFLLVVDVGGCKKNIFALSKSKKIDSTQIQKWIKEYFCVLIDYKYVGRHKDELIGYEEVKQTSLPDIYMFGNRYKAFHGLHCKDCALFNSTDGCGIFEYHNKGKSHCHNEFIYKKVT